jgi:prophage regulatory protein
VNTEDEKPIALRPADVAKTLQISERNLRTIVAEGRFPPPVRIGRLARWPRETVERWFADQAR